VRIPPPDELGRVVLILVAVSAVVSLLAIVFR
jgi:hypothetical protein